MTVRTVPPAPLLPQRAPRRFSWAYAPVILLGGLLSIQAVMVTLAVRDPGFGVEPHYYQQAANWDEHQSAMAESRALGWHAEIQTGPRYANGTVRVQLTLVDATGQAVIGAHVALTYFHNARSGQRAEIDLTESGAGTFSATLPLVRPGLWVFQLHAQRAGQSFLTELRTDLP